MDSRLWPLRRHVSSLCLGHLREAELELLDVALQRLASNPHFCQPHGSSSFLLHGPAAHCGPLSRSLRSGPKRKAPTSLPATSALFRAQGMYMDTRSCTPPGRQLASQQADEATMWLLSLGACKHYRPRFQPHPTPISAGEAGFFAGVTRPAKP
jgi:hypothetical protein